MIVADSSGKELRALLFSSYDFEVGETENSFQINIKRQEYETIPSGARLYIPGTEYGGLFRELNTNTKEDVISPGGLTWRGMMQKKIIVPRAGQDYAKDSGELNAVIKARVEAAFPGLFKGSTESTGVSVTNYQYDRYCTLEAGLTKLLKSKGYRLKIEYSQTDKAVIVSAVPIVNWSSTIEFSSDMQINYNMNMQGDGVNHLVCLGSGELSNRLVYDLYIDNNGNIGNTQYYFGVDEIAAVYDYPGAELGDLVQSGSNRLQELMNQNRFEITINSDIELAIGDIVGGRDYLSGMSVQSPVAGKIVKWENGFQTIEYKLENEAAEQTDENVGGSYLLSPSIGRKSITLSHLGTLANLQAFLVYENNYYSTDGSSIVKQDKNFNILNEYTLSTGHGNTLQLGSDTTSYSFGWNDQKIYRINMSTMQLLSPITLPTTGYTSGVVDDVNGIAYIFQRDTHPSTEEYYNFIAYDYVHSTTLYTKKTTMKMAAMQASDFIDGLIIVLNGAGTVACPNGYRVFDTQCNLMYEYVIGSKSTIEPEGVFIDRDTRDVYISYVDKELYKINV